jgi:sulfopropanediol 3-dehydrogenase
MEYIERILPEMPTKDFAEPAWRNWGQVVVVDDLDEAYQLGNHLAAEHVQIFTADPTLALDKMHNYGALFLGEKTCVSYGDKVYRRALGG